MLLLGVLAAQAEAAAPAVASDYDLLETEILTGSQASVTFSSLNSTYGSTYQHLQLRLVTRQNAAGSEPFGIRFNGDTSSSHTMHGLYGDGSSANSRYEAANDAFDRIAYSGNSDVADGFGATIIDILDAFETTKYTTVRALSGETSSNYITLTSGVYLKTNAIDSILIQKFTGSADYYTGSRFSLYGLKKAA